MSNPEANPLGAGGDVTKAAVRIKELGLAHPKEPQGQPESQPEPTRANPSEQAKPAPSASRPKDPETGKFVKAEPEGTERTEVEAQPDTAKVAETDDDSEELPEFIEALAERIGVDPSQFLEHVKAKVKVNGEERTVNLKELTAGYQMQSDYQRKTAEIAEERRKVSAELTQYQQQREHISSQLAPLLQQLETLVVDDTQKIKAAFDSGDYQEAARLQFIAEQRKQQLSFAKQEQQRIDGEKQRESRLQLEQHVQEQERILLERKPVWKDTEKGRKELQAIRDYLKAEGVPAQQADTLYEATPLLMAEKAMLWDQLQKQTKPKAMQEVKSKPKFLVPGPSKAASDPKKDVLRASLNRLRKTGDVKDAAKAFKAMGIVTPI